MASSSNTNWSSQFPSIRIFYGEDFSSWKVHMRTILRAKSLWSIIEKGFDDNTTDEEQMKTLIEDRLSNYRALERIQVCVNYMILQRIINASTAHGAWKILEAEFEGSTRTLAMKLSSVQRDCEDMLMGQNEKIDDSKPPKESVTKARAYKSSLSDQMATRRLRVRHSKIQWSGRAWVSKQLTHYPALQRNGSIITAHSFVYILADQQENYVGYLEDMYEDKKGQKKVKVRWFHHNQEAKGAVSQLNPHPREVLITPQTQVISAECLDGLATVLTPNHYEKYAHIDTSLHGVHMCFRQLKNNKTKPFSLLTLRGYLNQAILSSMQRPPSSNLNLKENILSKNDGEELACGDRRAKRVRSGDTSVELSSAQRKFSFKIDDKIELLCQDSGIRGCWFKCIILQVSMKHLKVQYEDVMDAETNDNLEEYVPAFRTAVPDKLNTRCDGRPRIRPCPNDSSNCVLEVGTAVDAWGGEGWWEGVVAATSISQDDSLQIYLPGENKLLPSEKKNIRISRDWDGDKWVDIKAKPDILSYLSSNNFDPTSLAVCFAKTNGIASVDHEVLKISELKAVKVDELKSLVTCASHGLKNMKVADTEKLRHVNKKGSSGDDECADNLDGHQVKC